MFEKDLPLVISFKLSFFSSGDYSSFFVLSPPNPLPGILILIQLILVVYIVKFNKITANTEFAKWTIALKGNTRLGSWDPLITVFASADQYITLFYVSFF